MIAALGTLTFLATLWLLAVVGAAMLEESGAKIAAALKGRPASPPVPDAVRIRLRVRWRAQPLKSPARPLRAAA
jgi:hypothetical protein